MKIFLATIKENVCYDIDIYVVADYKKTLRVSIYYNNSIHITLKYDKDSNKLYRPHKKTHGAWLPYYFDDREKTILEHVKRYLIDKYINGELSEQ